MIRTIVDRNPRKVIDEANKLHISRENIITILTFGEQFMLFYFV